MKRLMILGVVALGVAAIACGGGGGSQDTQAQKAAPATDDHGHDHDDHDGHDHPPATNTPEHPSDAGDAAGSPAGATGAQAEMLATGTEITLNGNMGCGHCNFQIGTSCSAAMKTADGHIVIFDNVPATTEMFQKRMEGAAVTVQGVVSYDAAGVAHMALKETPM